MKNKPAAHTPSPWNISGNDIVEVSTGKWIATMPDDRGEDICSLAQKIRAENKANAAFIVRAVNAHEEIIMALKDLETWADDACARTIEAGKSLDMDTNDTMRMLRKSIEKARIAIARAEGRV